MFDFIITVFLELGINTINVFHQNITEHKPFMMQAEQCTVAHLGIIFNIIMILLTTKCANIMEIRMRFRGTNLTKSF